MAPFAVTVPPDSQPGQSLQFPLAVHGQHVAVVQVNVPAGAGPGSILHVDMDLPMMVAPAAGGESAPSFSAAATPMEQVETLPGDRSSRLSPGRSARGCE